MKITVKREGRTWNVYVDGKLEEGGFFTRDAAELAASLIRFELENKK